MKRAVQVELEELAGEVVPSGVGVEAKVGCDSGEGGACGGVVLEEARVGLSADEGNGAGGNTLAEGGR